MKTLYIHARIWQDGNVAVFEPGELLCEDGIIIARGLPGELSCDGAEVVDLGGALVAPGLIDLHTHGRAGGDFTSADTETLIRMSHSYLASGTTTVMPTLASAPIEDFVTAAHRIAAVAAQNDGARLVGLHLEGRYLNPEKRGAHAAALLAPLDESELSALHERMCRPYKERGMDVPFRLSAALELDENGEFAATAGRLGIRLSLGHTTADHEAAMRAIEHGARSFTHLYNAMPPLHHRGGGAVAACFDAAAQGRDVMGELICDGLHIAPEMIRLAYRLLGRNHTLLITDSMEGTGCPDGEYTIAGERVLLKNGRAVTESGALAGSTLSLWQGVCNLSDMCDIPLAEAIRCATHNPARLIGLDGKLGTLTVGAHADMILIDPTARTLCGVVCRGVRV